MAGPTDATRAARKRVRPLLLTQLAAAGTMPCPRCGRPMRLGQRLDVGHSVDVVDGGAGSALRLEHMSCNREAGDRRNGRNRTTRRRVAGEDRDAQRRQRLNDKGRERLARMRRTIILPKGRS